ncbi:hypothetical protein GCM10023108_00320 [Saccharopolyspora hordei]
MRAVAGDPADLQIMYGVDGARHLVEWEAEWLPGYRGCVPVRFGNAAFRQLQLDVYGEVMDVLHLARERGLPDSAESWALQRGMLRHLEKVWRQPDRGLWEVRGRAASSRTPGSWSGWPSTGGARRRGGRAARTGAALAGDPRRGARGGPGAGVEPELRAFTQYYGGRTLDAALLIPSVGFLPGDDERVVGTVEAVQRELQHHRVLVDGTRPPMTTTRWTA